MCGLWAAEALDPIPLDEVRESLLSSSNSLAPTGRRCMERKEGEEEERAGGS